jgi:hypothetical protein
VNPNLHFPSPYSSLRASKVTSTPRFGLSNLQGIPERLADTVSDSGWKLFDEHLAKAKTILDQPSASAQKCPDRYIATQLVARGQSWDLRKATALFQPAVVFEPAYQYYYRTYATYLLPPWSGEEGDASRLAEESANRVGGEAGDALYCLITSYLRGALLEGNRQRPAHV